MFFPGELRQLFAALLQRRRVDRPAGDHRDDLQPGFLGRKDDLGNLKELLDAFLDLRDAFLQIGRVVSRLIRPDRVVGDIDLYIRVVDQGADTGALTLLP